MIIHVTSGLMATSALTANARNVGVEVKLAMNDRKLVKLLEQEEPKLIIVDLQTKGMVLEDLVGKVREVSAVPMIAYAQHVHEDLIQEAKELDFERVMTRGQFTSELPNIVASIQA